MPQFLAITSRGLSDVLAEELTELNFKVINKGLAGVLFDANWEGCYRANLELRTATRIIKPVLDFPAYDPQELYNNVLKHDFTKYINPSQTFAIDASVRESSFHDQRFVAMKVKDAIADQFREKFGERPSVERDTPDLTIMVKIVKNQVSLAIDTTGDSISNRGYRSEAGEAPLRENLAAGLLRLAGWQEDSTIVDPMCGSGTILIEAALRARGIAPASLRQKKFAFQKLKDFKPEVWDKVVTESMNKEKASSPIHFYGFDKDRAVLQKAKRNAERAGVENDITFQFGAVDSLEAPVPQGLMIVNPPYGERLGISEELKDVYRDLAFSLKRNFKGWNCWLLSGNEDLTKALKLKSTRRCPVFNGSIECRLLEYKIN
jgi:23S rRNA G2445 N2-methylase RlmL